MMKSRALLILVALACTLRVGVANTGVVDAPSHAANVNLMQLREENIILKLRRDRLLAMLQVQERRAGSVIKEGIFVCCSCVVCLSKNSYMAWKCKSVSSPLSLSLTVLCIIARVIVSDEEKPEEEEEDTPEEEEVDLENPSADVTSKALNKAMKKLKESVGEGTGVDVNDIGAFSSHLCSFLVPFNTYSVAVGAD